MTSTDATGQTTGAVSNGDWKEPGKRRGLVIAIGWATTSAPAIAAAGIPNRQSLLEIGTYFFKVGAFTIGGGRGRS